MHVLRVPNTSNLARLAFSPDGRSFLALPRGECARLWRVPPDGEGSTIADTERASWAVIVPGGEIVAGGYSEPASRHNPVGGREPFSAGPGGRHDYCAALSADGSCLFALDIEGPMRVVRRGPAGVEWGVPYDAGGNAYVRIFVDDARRRVVVVGERVRVLDMDTGAPLSGFTPDFVDRTSMATVALSPDGRRLVILGDQGLRSFDVDTGERSGRADVPSGEALAFAPDGRCVAAGDGDRIRLWEVATWHEQSSFAPGIGPITAVTFSPDGMLAAAGGSDGRIAVWDVG